MNLIMFMLLSITGLATFGILNVNAPNYGGPTAQVTEEARQAEAAPHRAHLQEGLLRRRHRRRARAAAGAAAAPAEGAPTIPKKADGTYDYTALTEKMVEIKKEFPSESKVIVGAEADIPYEVLVQTHGRDPRDARQGPASCSSPTSPWERCDAGAAPRTARSMRRRDARSG